MPRTAVSIDGDGAPVQRELLAEAGEQIGAIRIARLLYCTGIEALACRCPKETKHRSVRECPAVAMVFDLAVKMPAPMSPALLAVARLRPIHQPC